MTDPALSGPVLIRGRDFTKGQALVFVGVHTVGPAGAPDTLNGQVVRQYAELALSADYPPAARDSGFVTSSFTAGGNFVQPPPGLTSATTFPVTHCIGWQVDGLDFSETFVTAF